MALQRDKLREKQELGKMEKETKTRKRQADMGARQKRET
jgi:hypothetical protein